eukprot:gene5356-6682_t
MYNPYPQPNTPRRGAAIQAVALQAPSLDGLPPIETLNPDNLKDLTKSDLTAYLLSHNIQPGLSKPEMKKQMRTLIHSLTNKEILIHKGPSSGTTSPVVASTPVGAGGVVQPDLMSINPMVMPMNLSALNPTAAATAAAGLHMNMNPYTGAPFAYPQPPQHTTAAAIAPTAMATTNTTTTTATITPTTPAATTPVVASPLQSSPRATGANKEHTPDQCMDCHKQYNKECNHHRCKSCCVRFMISSHSLCLLHLREEMRRPTNRDLPEIQTLFQQANLIHTPPTTAVNSTPAQTPGATETLSPAAVAAAAAVIHKQQQQPQQPLQQHQPAQTHPHLQQHQQQQHFKPNQMMVPSQQLQQHHPQQPLQQLQHHIPPQSHPPGPYPQQAVPHNAAQMIPQQQQQQQQQAQQALAKDFNNNRKLQTQLQFYYLNVQSQVSACSTPKRMMIPKDDKYSFFTCYKCSKAISVNGAQLWKHIQTEHPDDLFTFLLDKVKNKQSLTTNPDQDNIFNQARQKAGERFSLTNQWLQELFSPTPPPEINEKRFLEDRKQKIIEFETRLQSMLDLFESQDNFIENISRESNLFYQFYDQLSPQIPPEELEQISRKVSFEMAKDLYCFESMVSKPSSLVTPFQSTPQPAFEFIESDSTFCCQSL